VTLRTHATVTAARPTLLNDDNAPLAWSPDGKFFLLSRDCDWSVCRGAIYRVNATTGARVRLTRDDRHWYLTRWTARGIGYLTYTAHLQPLP
jgi:hypothetical protein